MKKLCPIALFFLFTITLLAEEPNSSDITERLEADPSWVPTLEELAQIEDSEKCNELGMSFLNQGDWEQAEFMFQRAANLSKDYYDYWDWVYFYHFTGDETGMLKALEHALTVIESPWKHGRLNEIAARHFLNTGRAEEAMPYALTALEHDTWHTQIVGMGADLLNGHTRQGLKRAIKISTGNYCTTSEWMPAYYCAMAGIEPTEGVITLCKEQVEKKKDDIKDYYYSNMPVGLWYIGEEEEALALAEANLGDNVYPWDYMTAIFLNSELGNEPRVIELLTESQNVSLKMSWTAHYHYKKILDIWHEWKVEGIDPLTTIAQANQIISEGYHVRNQGYYECGLAFFYGYILEQAGHTDEAIRYYRYAAQPYTFFSAFYVHAFPKLRELGIDPLTAKDVEAPTIFSAHETFGNRAEVHILGWSQRAATHYTTDGSDPTPESPIYGHKIFIDESATIKAQQFVKETPVSPIAEAYFEKSTPPEPVSKTPDNLQSGLQRSYYEYDSFTSTDQISELEPMATDTVENVSIDTYLERDDFGCVFTGFVQIPETGTYTFLLNSDKSLKPAPIPFC